MKNYLRMTKTERELIIKLLLCAVIATLFSWAAVTANLFLYTDRGYKGSLRYGARRVLVQNVLS